ncbi:MAG: hypothetical protein V4527_11525 [Pseudomonadota bacterium]|jgi:hypothetical protein
MHRNSIPDVFEIPRPKLGNTLPWLTAFSMAAIIIGATLMLVFADGFY